MSFWSGLKGLGRNRDYNRGIVHFNRGEFAEAVVALESALETIGDERDPDYSLGAFYVAEARTQLGLACLHAGDPGAAESHLRRALDRNPDYADLHFHRATALSRLGRWAESQQECERALELNPQYLRARLLLAVCCERLENPIGARSALVQARDHGFDLPAGVQLDPWGGLEERTRQALLRAGESRSKAQYHLETGLERYTQGCLPEALAAFESAIAAEPGFPDLRAKRAALLAELDRHDDAVEEWSRALDLNPNYLEARLRRGVSWWALDRLDEAIEDLQWVLERRPNDPEILYLTGGALLCHGRREEARAHLERCREDPHRGSFAHELLALCDAPSAEGEGAALLPTARRGELIREAVARVYGG